MRKLIFTTCSIAACSWAALTAAPACAQDAPLFDKLDKNQDGQIAADEVDGDGKGLFERLLRNVDENKDGKLSKEEFTKGMTRRPDVVAPGAGPGAPGGAGGGRFVEEMFTRADKNGDGKISKEEAPERIAAIFDRLDANGDGAIDKTEMGRLAQLMAGGRPGQPGQPNPAGGPAQPSPELQAGAMVLKALDADGNGELSTSEIADAGKVIGKFDKNGDGKITKEELLAQLPSAAATDRPARPGQAARPGQPGGGNLAEQMLRRLQAADANKDGKISKEEAPERLKEVFGQIDGNSDGNIDEAEIKKFLADRRPQ